jgi:hypothetical protein
MIGGTMTTEGFIPYARIGLIDCPVRLVISPKATIADMKNLQQPMRDLNNVLLYATPGGGTARHPKS